MKTTLKELLFSEKIPAGSLCTRLDIFAKAYETGFGKDVFIDCDHLTIYAHKGSTAEKYAEQYKSHFKKI